MCAAAVAADGFIGSDCGSLYLNARCEYVWALNGPTSFFSSVGLLALLRRCRYFYSSSWINNMFIAPNVLWISHSHAANDWPSCPISSFYSTYSRSARIARSLSIRPLIFSFSLFLSLLELNSGEMWLRSSSMCSCVRCGSRYISRPTHTPLRIASTDTHRRLYDVNNSFFSLLSCLQCMQSRMRMMTGQKISFKQI